MNKKTGTVIVTIGAIFSTLLLLLTLAFAHIYFTIYTPERFTDGVKNSIDADSLKNEINSQIKLYSDTYGYDSEIITAIVDAEDLTSISGDYFTDYYNSFADGNSEMPSFSYNKEIFYNTITDNTEKALRPELFELEENRRLLADKYNDCIESAVSSLSINRVYNTLLSSRDKYLSLASLGVYFIPSLIAFIAIALLTWIIIVMQKHTKAAYFTSLAYFTISLIFSVPLAYLAQLDLPSKMTVHVGSALTYIDAVYTFLVTKTSYAYIAVSTAAFILFIAAVIQYVSKKAKS